MHYMLYTALTFQVPCDEAHAVVCDTPVSESGVVISRNGQVTGAEGMPLAFEVLMLAQTKSLWRTASTITKESR